MDTFSKQFSESISRQDLDRVNDAQKEKNNAIARERGVEAYRAERTTAYTLRWAEALVYMKPGDKILDIGGGWNPKSILDVLLREHKLDYYFTDIDSSCVDYIARELVDVDLLPDHAVQTDNTVVPFPDSYFDAIFSSHCLEHSLDLPTSLNEIKRALRPDGILFMAVPFGFDDADEHLYFFEIDEWVALLRYMGFEVINIHVGKVYADPYWDVAIVARKLSTRLDLERANTFAATHYKLGKTLLDTSSLVFQFPTAAERTENGFVIVQSHSGPIIIKQPHSGRLQQLICCSHDWSGIIEITDDTSQRLVVDLYALQWHVAAINISNLVGSLRVGIIAQNPLSHEAQIAIRGVLCLMHP